jgi:hypothetical protein
MVSFEQSSHFSVFGSMVFSWCSCLHADCLPASTTVIGSSCFDGCCRLSLVTFAPECKLSRIDDFAFAGCSALQPIRLPQGVQFMTAMAFFGVNPSVITIDRESRFFRTRDGFLTDICGTSLIRYLGDEADIVVGRYAECFSVGCFVLCASISKVVFEPDCGVSVLADSLFWKSSLAWISVPSSVTALAQDCFAQCARLSTIIFESGCQVSVFGPRACIFCSSLASIVIPSSVEAIRELCFHCCEKPAAVAFDGESRLSVIEQEAFSECVELEPICIPPSVLTVPESCFINCRKLPNAPCEEGRGPQLAYRD